MASARMDACARIESIVSLSSDFIVGCFRQYRVHCLGFPTTQAKEKAISRGAPLASTGKLGEGSARWRCAPGCASSEGVRTESTAAAPSRSFYDTQALRVPLWLATGSISEAGAAVCEVERNLMETLRRFVLSRSVSLTSRAVLYETY